MNLHMVNALGKGVIRGVKGMGAVVNVTDDHTYRPDVICLHRTLICVIGGHTVIDSTLNFVTNQNVNI